MTTTTQPIRRRAAFALLSVSALALAGCSAVTGGNPDPASASTASTISELAVLPAPQIIDILDALPVAERPDDLTASVEPAALTLSDEGGRTETLPMPEDEFYLSVAPYESRTHPCHFHSLTTCLGEMANEDVHVTVIDTTTGQTLIDEERTTYDNGFLGLWLPRDITANLTIDHDGEAATAHIATGDQDPTCLTTMQLT